MADIDPVDLSVALIRCPSVTPEEAGALDVLGEALKGLGFTVTRLPFSDPGSPAVDNLFARLGSGRPHFCFAGHTDVVPVGDRDAWTDDPFAATRRDGTIFGRGAADMKCAIAAFTAATADFLARRGREGGNLSLIHI